jgi:AcrR family transcriptional regulator
MADTRKAQDAFERILRAADRLFYGQGIRAVGVDAVAEAAGVTKRTLYYHFASKDDLVAAYLQKRADALPEITIAQPQDAVRAVLGRFDMLEAWFVTDRFRGCPFVNAVAELGAAEHPAGRLAAEFKAGRRAWFRELLTKAGMKSPDRLAGQLMVLVDGAIAAALVQHSAEPARDAREAARILLSAAGLPVDEPDDPNT